MGKKHNWSLTNPQWTVLEEEVFSRITYFQAQIIRDAFEEKASKESDESIGQRLDLPADLIAQCRHCRMRHLIDPEVSAKDLKSMMLHYRSPLERQADEGKMELESVPRAVRMGKTLSRAINSFSGGYPE